MGNIWDGRFGKIHLSKLIIFLTTNNLTNPPPQHASHPSLAPFPFSPIKSQLLKSSLIFWGLPPVSHHLSHHLCDNKPKIKTKNPEKLSNKLQKYIAGENVLTKGTIRNQKIIPRSKWLLYGPHHGFWTSLGSPFSWKWFKITVFFLLFLGKKVFVEENPKKKWMQTAQKSMGKRNLSSPGKNIRVVHDFLKISS